MQHMWTEEQYRRLCEACDAVLLDHPVAARVGIPWLHVIREHPVFLDAYSDLWNGANHGAKARRLLRHATLVAQRGVSIGQGMLSRRELYQSREIGTVDVLFVSHLVNEGHAGMDSDFYFGDLPAVLLNRRCTSAIMLINHTRVEAGLLTMRWRNAKVPRLLPAARLNGRDEARIVRALHREARLLTGSTDARGTSLDHRVRLSAAQHVVSAAAAANLRLATQVHRVVSRLRPRVVLLPFEGHAWERMVLLAAGAVDHPPLRVGYQHAAVFRLQHALRRRLPPAYAPDRVLCDGEVGAEQLEDAPGLSGMPIQVLGSARGTGGGISTLVRGSCAGRQRRCLVIPEGIPSECHLLFSSTLSAARAAPDIEFVWRLHPIVSAGELLRRWPELAALPPNVTWSHATLADDAQRCGWTLYRGSTSVVDAVRLGSTPVYFGIPGELVVDPLYQLTDLRPTVHSPDELTSVIVGPAAEDDGQHMRLRKYCERFFVPFDPRAVLDLLASHDAAVRDGHGH
jgi:hypothetical protein